MEKKNGIVKGDIILNVACGSSGAYGIWENSQV